LIKSQFFVYFYFFNQIATDFILFLYNRCCKEKLDQTSWAFFSLMKSWTINAGSSVENLHYSKAIYRYLSKWKDRLCLLQYSLCSFVDKKKHWLIILLNSDNRMDIRNTRASHKRIIHSVDRKIWKQDECFTRFVHSYSPPSFSQELKTPS
jgi:hypothetical protein